MVSVWVWYDHHQVTGMGGESNVIVEKKKPPIFNQKTTYAAWQ